MTDEEIKLKPISDTQRVVWTVITAVNFLVVILRGVCIQEIKYTNWLGVSYGKIIKRWKNENRKRK